MNTYHLGLLLLIANIFMSGMEFANGQIGAAIFNGLVGLTIAVIIGIKLRED